MKKILIIDDELAVATIFETALKHEGYEVRVATDGKSGIEVAKSDTFDLVLLDQMLPDMSGNDVLKQLKAEEATKNTLVAMLTNFGEDNLIKDAINIGAVEYILKYQVSVEDLVNKTKTLIGNSA
ncbi:MAG: DNA-binding response regulator [Armatimonadetes bacterium]|nr:MAG: DNA-binding response regulator [Armatimonadota bacterium]